MNSIYQDILDWSQDKSAFIKDALRRLIRTTEELTENDIDALVQLVKKECGDTSITSNATPLDASHVPTITATNGNYPKLICVKNPTNICALDDNSGLNFSNMGLTAVYGGNGSGKSSYSRILKKLCWSRNRNIELKKNVFNPSTVQQQVNFVVENNIQNYDFSWTENTPSNPILNSFFVFDNDCGDIYINKENQTEYKPVGIDILEKLVPTFEKIRQTLDASITLYNTKKPTLPENLLQTRIAQWYEKIESLNRANIDADIQFTQTDIDRKQELTTLTSDKDPQQTITDLTNRLTRIKGYREQFSKTETLFNNQNLNELRANRTSFENISKTYQLATTELKNVNTLEGFGNDPWRNLWEAARNYAHSAKLSDGQNFPSLVSLKKCVLCQQELDQTAQQRLVMFNEFVLNDISTKLEEINLKIQEKRAFYGNLIVPSIENFTDLEQLITTFRDSYDLFVNSVTTSKNLIITFLQNGGELNINLQTLTPNITSVITNIEAEIENYRKLLQDKNTLVSELDELTAKEFLFKNKTDVLKYFDECKTKSFVNRCKSKLDTTTISRKIGELMGNHAIRLQHEEFISHLNSFSSDLVSKVSISKTKTDKGNTFQKLKFKDFGDSINTVLSEGEQKIIALSNFLAECTIDNRLNTIIFDDPVTSLDIEYRESIVNKIVQLSENRQIIVFTHDLYFLRSLKDEYKKIVNKDCMIIGIDKYNGISGIVTDEIPYLAKNVQERVDSIRGILNEHDTLDLNDVKGREEKLNDVRTKFRMLLERSVEEILSNKTYERFSKNIHLKKGNLSSYVVTDETDVDSLVGLYGKYSSNVHDGGISTILSLPTKTEVEKDLKKYSCWREEFKRKLTEFKKTNN